MKYGHAELKYRKYAETVVHFAAPLEYLFVVHHPSFERSCQAEKGHHAQPEETGMPYMRRSCSFKCSWLRSITMLPMQPRLNVCNGLWMTRLASRVDLWQFAFLSSTRQSHKQQALHAAQHSTSGIHSVQNYCVNWLHWCSQDSVGVESTSTIHYRYRAVRLPGIAWEGAHTSDAAVLKHATHACS